MKWILSWLVVLAVCASSSVAAQQSVYLGVSGGSSTAKFDAADYSLGIVPLGPVSGSQNHRSAMGKIFVGYDFAPGWAIEGGYANLGKPAFNYSFIGTSAGFTGQAEDKADAWFIAGKATLPVNQQFSLFGKLGAGWNRLKSNQNGEFLATRVDNTGGSTLTSQFFFNLPGNRSKSTTGVLYGIGAEYNFDKQTSVRIEYENFGKFGETNSQTGRATIDAWSVGVAYKF